MVSSASNNISFLYRNGTGVTLRASTELGVPIAARIAHGDFALYYDSTSDSTTKMLSCSAPADCGNTSIIYPTQYCRNIPPTLWFHLGSDAGAAIARAIGPRGYKKFIGPGIEQTSFFETICHRHGGLLFSHYYARAFVARVSQRADGLFYNN
ncbi:hypothetical protein E4U26_006983 [Claviceps purpurea]|nr:hypothetical protein E4U26_006983 [Claviceps purpurea]